MKKIFKLYIIAMFLLVVTLSGCDLSESEQNKPQNEQQTETTIDYDNLGYTITDTFNLMNKWITIDEQYFKEQLLGFSCENVYVNNLNILKIVSSGKTYPIIDFRENFKIDTNMNISKKEILKFSILQNGSFVVSYYDGSYVIFKNLWGLSGNGEMAIKSIVINKDNCGVLIYEDNTYTVIGKLKKEQVDKDDSRLIYEKGATTCKVAGVFSTKIEKIEIPKTYMGMDVMAIKSSAFTKLKKLEEITIPKSIKYVDAYAFSGCTNLKKVNYCGSEEDLEKIEFSRGNIPLLNASITYDYS